MIAPENQLANGIKVRCFDVISLEERLLSWQCAKLATIIGLHLRKIAQKTRQLQSELSCQANVFQNKTTIPVQTRKKRILEEAPLDTICTNIEILRLSMN